MSEVKITVESGYIPRVYPIPYKGGLVDMSYDFIAKDVIMLHPVYAWMDWICFLNHIELWLDLEDKNMFNAGRKGELVLPFLSFSLWKQCLQHTAFILNLSF